MTAAPPIPLSALVFAAAAVAAEYIPGVDAPSLETVEHVVSLALIVILFAGGRKIGWGRFRESAAAIAVVGVVGTFLTTAVLAVLAHVVFGFDWYLAVLLGTALAPTDPAVVFSVLGKREIEGRSGTILEGESGANDPVGIALMVGLLAAGELTGAAALDVAVEFALQMFVGAAVGLLGGLAMRRLLPRISLAALMVACTVVAVLMLFGLAVVAHGSGFLAVFVAGILVGPDTLRPATGPRGISAKLDGVGEVVAFAVLGLTVDVDVLVRSDVLWPGLVLGVLLAVVVRPAAVGLCLLPVDLQRGERAFILLAGLKGAVPLLLGTFLLAEQVEAADRLFGIVVVAVLLSVIVQGGLVPAAVERLGLAAPEPTERDAAV